MDRRALFNLTYGVFLLATKEGNKVNASITNTCIQVAESPVRVAISVLNASLTCQMIQKTGAFTLSLLDQSTDFKTIQHFGFQSGRNVDKFAGEYGQLPTDERGIPYLKDCACAFLSAQVISSQDLGSHTLFIAEVVDAQKLRDKAPLTYADYHAHVKPKPEAPKEQKTIVGWRCKICGFEVEGETLDPAYVCPLCGHGVEDFEPIYAK